MVRSVSPGFVAGMISGFLLMVISLPGLANRLSDLQPLLWQNRLILVSAPSLEADALQARLQAAEADINDRHIVWFIFDENRVLSNYPGLIDENLGKAVASRRHGDRQNSLQVVLIGKDGGSKLVSDELDLKHIFKTIDGMPMRQFEMRQGTAS